MRTRSVIATVVVGVAALSLVAAAGKPAKKSATVTFTKPTLIATGVATGTVVFEHDDEITRRFHWQRANHDRVEQREHDDDERHADNQ